MTREQKSDPSWFLDNGKDLVAEIVREVNAGRCFIVTVGKEKVPEVCSGDGDLISQSTSASLGTLFRMVLDAGVKSTLMCIGGDTLQAVFRAAGISRISPVCEIKPGIVFSEIEYKDRKHVILTKSGGFGDENALIELQRCCKACR